MPSFELDPCHKLIVENLEFLLSGKIKKLAVVTPPHRLRIRRQLAELRSYLLSSRGVVCCFASPITPSTALKNSCPETFYPDRALPQSRSRQERTPPTFDKDSVWGSSQASS
jgi:hypothetical protein